MFYPVSMALFATLISRSHPTVPLLTLEGHGGGQRRPQGVSVGARKRRSGSRNSGRCSGIGDAMLLAPAKFLWYSVRTSKRASPTPSVVISAAHAPAAVEKPRPAITVRQRLFIILGMIVAAAATLFAAAEMVRATASLDLLVIGTILTAAGVWGQMVISAYSRQQPRQC